jgi:hypothetical protein
MTESERSQIERPVAVASRGARHRGNRVRGRTTTVRTATTIRIEDYLSNKSRFDRRRRKLKLDFDALYRLFADGVSSAEIARRAGVSRPRINLIFKQYFRDFFGMTDLERLRRREKQARDAAMRRLVEEIEKDRVLEAVAKSAERGGRRVAPILAKRRGEPRKRYRHRAVLVDGRDVEPVHHLRNAQPWPGGITYATTSLSRKSLESSKWSIFYIDVPSYRRRVLRCRNAKLLRALFPAGVQRKHIYVPLDGRPEDPIYDFLADENNWG